MQKSRQQDQLALSSPNAAKVYEKKVQKQSESEWKPRFWAPEKAGSEVCVSTRTHKKSMSKCEEIFKCSSW